MQNRNTLELAKKILIDVKKTVTSSNDIIPRHLMPLINIRDEKELDPYKKIFGTARINEYLRYTHYVNTIRRHSADVVSEQKISCPTSTQYLITAHCGVGECAEVANLVASKLLINGCNQVNIIGIASNNITINHAFVIIGNVNSLDETLNSFDRLDNSCILVDPFLNIIGPANQTNQLLKKYIDAYRMNRLTSVVELTQSNRPLVMTKMLETKPHAEFTKLKFGIYQKMEGLSTVTQSLTTTKPCFFQTNSRDTLKNLIDQPIAPPIQQLMKK